MQTVHDLVAILAGTSATTRVGPADAMLKLSVGKERMEQEMESAAERQLPRN